MGEKVSYLFQNPPRDLCIRYKGIQAHFSRVLTSLTLETNISLPIYPCVTLSLVAMTMSSICHLIVALLHNPLHSNLFHNPCH